MLSHTEQYIQPGNQILSSVMSGFQVLFTVILGKKNTYFHHNSEHTQTQWTELYATAFLSLSICDIH